jgi:YgiT-type zinc finger domain-containing protein
MSSNSIQCAACGKPGIQLREVTRGFGRGHSLLVIEGIPLCSCPHCGESYFAAQTLHELERIKTLRGSIAQKRQVSVAGYRKSA